MGYLLWIVARAQVRAQTFDARHWIYVITKMFFYYLIVNLAQKAEKIQLFETQKSSKISNFFDFLLIFSNFKFMNFHSFYSYNSDQGM